MLFKRYLAMAAGAMAILLLAACGDVTQHQPGVYQGQQDPLATAEAAEARSAALRDRAADAFTDR